MIFRLTVQRVGKEYTKSKTTLIIVFSQAGQAVGGGGGEEEGEEESLTASSRDQREAELSVFWSYIVGMLTNVDSLAIERIHQMLRIFAMQVNNFNKTKTTFAIVFALCPLVLHCGHAHQPGQPGY